MKLGEFREITKDLPDDTELYVNVYIDDGEWMVSHVSIQEKTYGLLLPVEQQRTTLAVVIEP